MRSKIALWLALSLLLSGIFFLNFWRSAPQLLSFSYLRTTGAYPWVALALCAFWVYLKRSSIEKDMHYELNPVRIAAGAGLVAVSILLRNQAELPFLAFTVLLSSLGVFITFFGSAAYIPTILLGVYGFVIGFPVLFTEYFEVPYSLVTVKITSALVKALGYPLSTQGQVFSITSLTGETLAGYVGAPSSGIASITLFVALYALMTLDFKLPGKIAGVLFLLGLIGTSLQNVFRLVLIILAGYYNGRDAMWLVHDYAGYFIFPAWYAVFIFIYFKTYDKIQLNFQSSKH